MKILVIPTTDWIGHPVPNRLNFIFDRLAKNHEVDVCHFNIFGEKVRETECNLIDIDNPVKKDITTYYLYNSIKHLKKITSIGQDYDVIISSNIIPGLWANFSDTPVIIDYLDHLPESASSYYRQPLKSFIRKTANFITDINISNASGIITPTLYFKKYLKNKTNKKIYVIPNGIDTDIIHPSDSSDIEKKYSLAHPVIGYVGSLEKWIDLESVVKLMPSLLQRYSRIKLLIVGPSLHTNYALKLKNLADDIGVGKEVIFTGGLKYNELAPYISAMDVGLNPRKERAMNKLTLGSKVLNYLGCGVPVLSKNMPSVEKIFGKDKGVFTYHDDEGFLGELVLALNKEVDPSIVNKFEWNKLANSYEKAIYDVLR